MRRCSGGSFARPSAPESPEQLHVSFRTRLIARRDTREHENDDAGLYTRGQAPPSTTSGLVVCERLD